MNSPKVVNARGEERINVWLPVTLRVGWRGGLVAHASTVDLSEGGIRLRADFALRLGQDVEAMVNEDMGDPRTYRVVWVRKSEAGYSGYEAGLELLTQTNFARAA